MSVQNIVVRRLATRLLLLSLAIVLAGGLAASSQVNHVRAAESDRESVQLTYTKWFDPGFPTIGGVVGGDITGTLGGKVTSATVTKNGRFILLEATYVVDANDPSKDITMMLKGRQNIAEATGVLHGVVTSGWLTGERVHAEFQAPPSCTVAGVTHSPCFPGTISIGG